ncbi:MAG: P-loop containing nucleoside triphosphate hydrolase protein [Podila humilis]|nr:MAG: P-loop containing nucleoside triphosphate hydrolase protein [Podila humilis]
MHRGLDKTQAIVQHILRHIPLPRRCTPDSKYSLTKPLVVGLSGPQGIGKTTITNKLVSTLTGAPHNLRVFTFSMDDLYLSFKEQEMLREAHPNNKLIEFRGLPGTHDLKLGSNTFRALCDANLSWYESDSGHHTEGDKPRPVVLQPSYDKAAFSGCGDQVPKEQWKQEQGPFDIVLFEGWSLGFRSIRDRVRMKKIYEEADAKGLFLAQHSLESLEWIDNTLREYERDLYEFMDIFVHLSAPNLSTIFKWRAEQEKDLWAKKGTGMGDEQVREFVKRFMPAYELYLERLKSENVFSSSRSECLGSEEIDEAQGGGDGGSKRESSLLSTLPFRGRHLRVDLDQDRDMISTTLVE